MAATISSSPRDLSAVDHYTPKTEVREDPAQLKTPQALYAFTLSFLNEADKVKANIAFVRTLGKCDFIPKSKQIIDYHIIICTNLSPRDLSILASVSKNWKTRSEHASLWNTGPQFGMFMGRTNPKQTWFKVNTFYRKSLAIIKSNEDCIKKYEQATEKEMAMDRAKEEEHYANQLSRKGGCCKQVTTGLLKGLQIALRPLGLFILMNSELDRGLIDRLLKVALAPTEAEARLAVFEGTQAQRAIEFRTTVNTIRQRNLENLMALERVSSSRGLLLPNRTEIYTEPSRDTPTTDTAPKDRHLKLE